jgi:hypothetical protein
VRWDSTEGVFKTRIEDGAEETIVHGDGRWTIFCKNEIEPFKHGALLPAALVWARHAFAIRDWAKGSVAHGNAKIIGEMPEGVPMQNENGTTEEAAAFMQLLEAVCYSDAGVGIRPAGSKTDYLVNGSTAWQVFDNLVQNAEKAAARVYLGTDGTLGAQGGAPGVDIQALFGVAATIVEGDLECLERGFKSGVIEPWTALNFGDSSRAPNEPGRAPGKILRGHACSPRRGFRAHGRVRCNDCSRIRHRGSEAPGQARCRAGPCRRRSSRRSCTAPSDLDLPAAPATERVDCVEAVGGGIR